MKFSEFVVPDKITVHLDEFSIHNPFSGLLEGMPTMEMALHNVERHIKKSFGERKTLLLNQPDLNLPGAFHAAIMFLTSNFTTHADDHGTELVAVMFVSGFDTDVPSLMIEEIGKHDWKDVSCGFEF